MNVSRTKFVILFILSGFVFLFVTTSLLGSTGTRGFPKAPDSMLHTGGDSPIAWKRTASAVLVSVKVVLIGPLLLTGDNFLRDDPPPPFIGIYLILYWIILASVIHYLSGKLRSSSVAVE